MCGSKASDIGSSLGSRVTKLDNFAADKKDNLHPQDNL